MKSRKLSSDVVPTKHRIQTLLLNQGVLSPYYPIRLVIGLGIALTTCGVILSIFGVVAAVIEASMASLYSGIWVGVVVIISGLVAIISGKYPHSSTQLYIFLFSSMFTIAVTGFLAILTANSVIREHDINASFHFEANEQSLDLSLTSKSPAMMVNSLLFAFSSLACLLSFINFCVSGHEACQCYSSNGVLSINDPLSQLGPESLGRRDRIMAWIVQQSTIQEQLSTTPSPNSTISKGYAAAANKSKLRPLNSTASTTSTRLSAYEA